MLVCNLNSDSCSNKIEGVSEKVSSNTSETTAEELAKLRVRIVLGHKVVLKDLIEEEFTR
jgi:hypothetical protein